MSAVTPDAIEPLELWRAWRYDQGRLFSVFQDEEWVPGEPYEATCAEVEHHVSLCERPPEEQESRARAGRRLHLRDLRAVRPARAARRRGVRESQSLGKGHSRQRRRPRAVRLPIRTTRSGMARRPRGPPAYGVPIIVETGPAPPEPDPGPASRLFSGQRRSRSWGFPKRCATGSRSSSADRMAPSWSPAQPTRASRQPSFPASASPLPSIRPGRGDGGRDPPRRHGHMSIGNSQAAVTSSSRRCTRTTHRARSRG